MKTAATVMSNFEANAEMIDTRTTTKSDIPSNMIRNLREPSLLQPSTCQCYTLSEHFETSGRAFSPSTFYTQENKWRGLLGDGSHEWVVSSEVSNGPDHTRSFML